jgi:cell pole-organizing protein PopZ
MEVEARVAPVAEVKPEIVPERALQLADPAPTAADAVPAAALPTQALEQVIAEMLEPAIRQWLQAQLPRMIESVVREEVARAVAAEREAGKA